LGSDKLSQPIMEMYMVADENKFSTYMAMTDQTSGELTWIKQEIEDESFATLLDPNNEEKKELNEKSITDVKYLGTYTVNGVNLEKYEITMSFEAFNEILGQNLSMLTETLGDDAELVL